MNSLKEKLRAFPYWLYILRGVAIYFITLLIKSFMGMMVLATYSDFELTLESGMTKIPFFVISIVYFVGTVLLLNSVLYLFCTYDKQVMNSFLDEEWEKVKMFKSFAHALKSREFAVEFSVILFFTLLGCLVGWYPEVSYSFSALTTSEIWMFWLPFMIMPTITFILYIWRRYEAYRYWHHLDRSDNIKKLYSIFSIFLRGVLIIVLYCFFYQFLPMAAIMFISLSSVMLILVDALTVLGFVAAAVAFILLLYGIGALRAINKRKKLIKGLKEVAPENGYELSEIKRPYASLFKKSKECNFTLKKDGKTFSCHFVGSPFQRVPLFFVSSTTAYYMHRLGTKNHHLTFLSVFEYDFEGEGDKIIILNPVPKRSFVSMDEQLEGAEYNEYCDTGRLSSVLRRHSKEAKSTREIVPGDKIWGYAIYNTTSFISAVDRKCLGRYNGMFE